MTPQEKAALFWQQPATTPEWIGPLDYLIDPPGALSSSAAWRRFITATLQPMIAARPHDPNLPRLRACADALLAWRATIPESQRFWKAD